MKKYFAIALLLSCLRLASQPPDHFYTKYGGTGIDIGYGLQEIYDRQYIVIGSTTSFGAGGTDAYLFLLDSLGRMKWQKTFGGIATDMGKSVLFNPADSGFVFCGYTNSFGNGGFDLYLVRTDKNGDMLWQNSFGGLDWDFGSDLAFTPDGNILACGHTYSSLYGKSDGYLLKVNMSNGALMREQRFGGMEEDEFNRIKPTSDGNFCLSGNTASYGDVNSDFWFFKVNSAADSVTSKSYGTSNKKERCYDFMEDKVNNLVFCGSYDTSFYNTGKNVSYILKISLNGVFIDDSKVPGGYTDDDKFLSIANTLQLNDYFFSRKVFYTGGVYENEVQPFMYSANYIFLAATTYGGAGDDEAFKVIHTKDNGFAMIGYTNGFSPSQDVLFIKLNSGVNNANYWVGLEENALPKSYEQAAYYFDGAVYFQNLKREPVRFEIIDVRGQLVQAGTTSSDQVAVNRGLAADLYLIRLYNGASVHTLKFIKY